MTDKLLIDRSVLEQALEAFEDHAKQYPHMQKGYTVDAANALRAALEQSQTEQEPALWIRRETLEQVQRVPPNEEEPENGVAGGQRLLMNVVLSAIPHSYYGQVPLYTKLDSEHNHA